MLLTPVHPPFQDYILACYEQFFKIFVDLDYEFPTSINFDFMTVLNLKDFEMSSETPPGALVGSAKALIALQTFLNVTKPIFGLMALLFDCSQLAKSDSQVVNISMKDEIFKAFGLKLGEKKPSDARINSKKDMKGMLRVLDSVFTGMMRCGLSDNHAVKGLTSTSRGESKKIKSTEKTSNCEGGHGLKRLVHKYYARYDENFVCTTCFKEIIQGEVFKGCLKCSVVICLDCFQKPPKLKLNKRQQKKQQVPSKKMEDEITKYPELRQEQLGAVLQAESDSSVLSFVSLPSFFAIDGGFMGRKETESLDALDTFLTGSGLERFSQPLYRAGFKDVKALSGAALSDHILVTVVGMTNLQVRKFREFVRNQNLGGGNASTWTNFGVML